VREESKNREKLQKQPKNKLQNDNKYVPIRNYFECKWTKHSNQKTQGDGMDKIARPGAQVNVSGGRKQRRWGLLVKFGLGTLLVNHGE